MAESVSHSDFKAGLIVHVLADLKWAKIVAMRTLPRVIAETIFWFSLWIALPALLLYPVAVFALRHSQYSDDIIGKVYIISVAVLFFPSAFALDFLYRKFILSRRNSN